MGRAQPWKREIQVLATIWLGTEGGGRGGRGYKGNLSSEQVRRTVRAYNGVTAGWGGTIGGTDVEPLSSVSVKIGVH